MAEDKDSKESPSESSAKGLLGEALKKVFTTGVSAAFMTEESIRAYLGEVKLPKDILNLVLQSANKSKEEITQRVSKEAVAILQKIDVVKELSRFVETHKFKVQAEIEILKKDKKESEDVGKGTQK